MPICLKNFGEKICKLLLICKIKSFTKTFLHKTTRKMWYGIKSNLSYLHVFGCCAYAHIHKDNKCKINSLTQECIFLGSKYF